MNRMLLTTAMSAMLAFAAPGVASAHNAKRHHRAHHHHAIRATVRTFGSARPPAGAGSTTSTPVTPAPDSGATAGTVTSFTGGVLTITLTNGSTVSGQVTERTELHCLPAAPPLPAEGEDRGDDEGNSESSDGGPSTSGHQDGASHSDGNSSSGGGDGEGTDNPGTGNQGEGDQSCTTASLVAGTVVREAELSVSSAGAVWDHVNLIG
jgi:hypothetical protein